MKLSFIWLSQEFESINCFVSEEEKARYKDYLESFSIQAQFACNQQSKSPSWKIVGP